MIVLDIETSGLHPEKHGIWQIGALDLFNPGNTFLQEGRIDDEDEVSEGALKVTGKTETELRDLIKQAQKNLIGNFLGWTDFKIKNCICQNPQFDLGFINYKARKYGLKLPLHHRAFDLHSIAAIKYYEVNGCYLIEVNHSDMGLSNILKFCGMLDNRKVHNALEDAKLTAECYSRIIYKAPLFSEFSEFKIPGYLLK